MTSGTVTYDQVLTAARQHVVREQKTTNIDAMFAVAEIIGIKPSSSSDDAFYGKVKRALSALVKDGTLRKVSRGEREPIENHGWQTADEPRYYVPERYEELARSANAARDAVNEARTRKSALMERALAAGLEVSEGSGVATVAVGLDDFERLLALAERRDLVARHPGLAKSP